MDWTDLAQDSDMWQVSVKNAEHLGLMKCGDFVG